MALLPADRRRDLVVDEIKQKFGSLVVRLSGEHTAETQSAIEEAKRVALVTCEVCGAPGELAERRGWLSVKCAGHQNWTRFDDLIWRTSPTPSRTDAVADAAAMCTLGATPRPRPAILADFWANY